MHSTCKSKIFKMQLLYYVSWILNYALTPTPLNTRPTHTEREKRVNAPTTLPLINGSYTNYPPPLVTLPGYLHSLNHFSSLQFSARETLHVFRALITFTFDLCLILNPDFY